ncbi:PTS sugar transporter subunit IIA [Amycolatopsis albispora]|uniref:Mannitol-specific phosphotransferase enzyme IIA component n=1 Tax=Amycolatopsis albispora TaxID=1804986 RepID=A0A344L8N1_9PSEU|nr:PTS sugar transporter subunit IIA [Amycolatopsis albispora]AXB44405.1 PTS sugar transporter subunit IIA [Amycolatopsis albispora]
MAELLEASGIRLGASAADRDDAIRQVGAVLVEIGAVDPAYVDGMLEREESVSTFVGEAVAIPHGTNAAREHVRRTALAVVQFPGGVDWGGQEVKLCVGIAAQGSEQVQILSALARTLLDAEQAAQLREASDPDTILRILTATEEEAVQ